MWVRPMLDSALRKGVEWNYRVVTSIDDNSAFADVLNAFEDLYKHPSTKNIDHEWIKQYEARRKRPTVAVVEVDIEVPEPPPAPHKIQIEALNALEKDHKFLTVNDVFTDDVVETWIKWKRDEEIDPLALRPHPHEFNLYYDS